MHSEGKGKEVLRIRQSLVERKNVSEADFQVTLETKTHMAVFYYHVPETGSFIHSLIPSPGVAVTQVSTVSLAVPHPTMGDAV